MEKIELNHKVLSAMGDKASRDIYRQKIDYGNGSNEAMECMIRSVGGIEFIDFMQRHKDYLYVFGAGALGKDLADTWDWKYSFQAYIDNDQEKHGKHIGSVPVISLDSLREDREHAAIIIMSKYYSDEIEQQLRENYFHDRQIFNLGRIYRQFNKKQYFDLEYLIFEDRENFVDCGVLDGETSLNFLEICGNRVNKIWMFEPDKKNAQKVRRNFEGRRIDYEIIEKGVWSSAATLKFNALGNGCAGIDENGEDYIETVRLDDALAECQPTFIKMDIEGAELEALKGAEQVIKRCRPKLAISVYHKREDINEIPELLLTYHHDYKFYLRHYSLMSSETILYAI